MWFLFICGLIPSTSDVIDVGGPSAFSKAVMETRGAVLSSFYVSDASGDSQVTQFLEKLSEKNRDYGISTVRVDCSKGTNKKVCSAARGVPSFVLYLDEPKINPYTRKLFREGVNLDVTSLDARGIERVIAKAYPSLVQLKTSSSIDKLELSKDKSWSLVLFTEKQSITMLLRSIAFSAKGLAVVQAYGVALEEINQKLEISKESMPVLALISNIQTPSVVFNGDLKDRNSVLDWIKQHTGIETGDTLPETGEMEGAGKKTAGYMDPLTGESMKTFAAESFSSESLDDSAWILGVTGDKDQLATFESWEKMTSSCEGVVKPAIVVCSPVSMDGGNSFGSKLCSRALPYVAVISHGASSSDRKKFFSDPIKGSHIHELNSDSLENAKKRAIETLPETSVLVIPEEGIQDLVQNSQNQNVLSVVILSDKPSIPQWLRNLALTVNKYAQVAFLVSPSKEFLSNIGNPRLPTAVAIFFGPSDDPRLKDPQPGAPRANFQIVVYDAQMFGPVKFPTLQSFIFQAYSRSSFAEKLAKGEGNLPGDNVANSIAGDTQKELVWSKSEADWMEHCGSTYRGICAVGLLKNAISSDEVSVLTKTMTDLGRAGAAFKFIAVDASCQFGFASRFDAQLENLPALVAYSPSKGRYALYRGVLKDSGIKEFLNAILSGKTSTIAIPQRPNFSVTCDGQDLAAENVVETSDDKADADDLMAEIRREEEARKAQLKNELREDELRRKQEEEQAQKVKKVIKKVKKKKGKKKT